MKSDKPDERPVDSQASRRTCPICGKPAVQSSRPFCSPRCADIDLYRWLSGAYAIPVTPDEAEGQDDEDRHG